MFKTLPIKNTRALRFIETVDDWYYNTAAAYKGRHLVDTCKKHAAKELSSNTLRITYRYFVGYIDLANINSVKFILAYVE